MLGIDGHTGNILDCFLLSSTFTSKRNITMYSMYSTDWYWFELTTPCTLSDVKVVVDGNVEARVKTRRVVKQTRTCGHWYTMRSRLAGEAAPGMIAGSRLTTSPET